MHIKNEWWFNNLMIYNSFFFVFYFLSEHTRQWLEQEKKGKEIVIYLSISTYWNNGIRVGKRKGDWKKETERERGMAES